MTLSLSGGCALAGEATTYKDMAAFYSDFNTRGESTISLALGNGNKVEAGASMTEKGNGTLQLGNLQLRIYDRHDDGAVYEHGLLHLDLTDLDGDGINEVVLFGVLKLTGEEQGDPVSYENITHIYSLDCDSGLFFSLYSNSESYLELYNDKTVKTKCKPVK